MIALWVIEPTYRWFYKWFNFATKVKVQPSLATDLSFQLQRTPQWTFQQIWSINHLNAHHHEHFTLHPSQSVLFSAHPNLCRADSSATVRRRLQTRRDYPLHHFPYITHYITLHYIILHFNYPLHHFPCITPRATSSISDYPPAAILYNPTHNTSLNADAWFGDSDCYVAFNIWIWEEFLICYVL